MSTADRNKLDRQSNCLLWIERKNYLGKKPYTREACIFGWFHKNSLSLVWKIVYLTGISANSQPENNQDWEIPSCMWVPDIWTTPVLLKPLLLLQYVCTWQSCNFLTIYKPRRWWNPWSSSSLLPSRPTFRILVPRQRPPRLAGCGIHHSSFLSKRKSTRGKTWARTRPGNTPSPRNRIAQVIYTSMRPVGLSSACHLSQVLMDTWKCWGFVEKRVRQALSSQALKALSWCHLSGHLWTPYELTLKMKLFLLHKS